MNDASFVAWLRQAGPTLALRRSLLAGMAEYTFVQRHAAREGERGVAFDRRTVNEAWAVALNRAWGSLPCRASPQGRGVVLDQHTVSKRGVAPDRACWCLWGSGLSCA